MKNKIVIFVGSLLACIALVSVLIAAVGPPPILRNSMTTNQNVWEKSGSSMTWTGNVAVAGTVTATNSISAVSTGLVTSITGFNGSSYGGLQFDKTLPSDVLNSPGIVWKVGGVEKWTIGMDIVNHDQVLAYDWSNNGDVLRLSAASDGGGTNKMVFGSGVGSPSGYLYAWNLDSSYTQPGLTVGQTIAMGNLGVRLDFVVSYATNIFGNPAYSGGAIGMRTFQPLILGVNNIEQIRLDPNAGMVTVKTNLTVNYGLGSLTTTTASLTPTGWTNASGVNMCITITNAVDLCVYDNAGGIEYTNLTITAPFQFRLQPSGYFTGTSISNAPGGGAHAW